ncbi:DNA internalization-related competence protein ComEC/Rec2 [Oceanicoccus sagamiensis]|uniref:DNA internalization-related competence protein ComEC/Rec2 n=2 Tax=Oceanicoccus sagamiensis TaxID=716816 RepID=A0A1X9NHG5_9GAMM|nr:DNA internalization-related competence protein ComEC/Rec2 [Oceanicoccus sagamiensis]
MAAAAGIAVVSICPQLPPLTSLILCLPLAAWLALKRFYCLLGFTAGLAWGALYGHQLLASQLVADWQQQPLWLEGQVVGLPLTSLQRGQSVTRFQLRLSQPPCIAPQDCRHGLRLVQLNWYQQHSSPQTIIPGQQWRLQVSLKRPYGMANPGGFDYQSWLIQQGVGAVGRVIGNPHNRLIADNNGSVDRWRWWLGGIIDDAANELSHRDIIKALLIGDRRGISPQQWQLFAATGTTHLMVISGLHLGLVTTLVFTVVRALVLLLFPRLPAERCAALVAILFALIYALAAGFTLPTQRALIMISVFMLGLCWRRQFPAGQAMAVALLLCLMHDPLATVSLSFYLSFAAVACLFYGGVGRYPVLGGLEKILLAQGLVFIGLLPVLAIFVGQLGFISPLANMVLVPFFSLVLVPVNFIALLTSLISLPAATVLWQLTDSLLTLSLDYLQLLNSMAVDLNLSIAYRPWPVQVLALLAVLVLLSPTGVPAKYWGGLLLLPLMVYQPTKLAAGDLRVTVLDVGQGLSVVLNTRHHTLVYDVGPSYSAQFDTATAVVVPYLRYLGINRVDRLVLSHGDNDHAGAAAPFIQQVDTRRLFYGDEVLSGLHASASLCTPQSWFWDGVHFEFLQLPGFQRATKSNNRSCVLKVTAGKQRFLLPGDIEAATESRLLNTYPTLLTADVLLAPHHGSASSSSWAFIKRVDPDRVVFSSGYRNQFGHPHPAIVDRYRVLNSAFYLSSQSGALTFTVSHGQMLGPSQYRQQHRRYWLSASE